MTHAHPVRRAQAGGDAQTTAHADPIVRLERWLPLAIGAAWWLAMYPGLFGEDSLLNLAEARNGPVTVWFTAWWIYVIRAVTLGTRVIPLLTLFGVLVLTFAIRQWAAACLPARRARTIAVCAVCATPLVGALGIQVRHDVEMTAGLLLCAAVAARVVRGGGVLRASDAALLGAGALLIPVRHNGVPIVAVAAVGCYFVLRPAGARAALALLAAAAAGFIVTQTARYSAGSTYTVDPLQSVEWAITDISCVLSKPDVEVPAEVRTTLAAIARPEDWPQPSACRFMDKGLFNAPSFQRDVVREHSGAVLRAWVALAVRNPRLMVAAHAERVRLFLPPFVTGLPRTENTPFLHSTILDNEFGLRWKFPAVAGTARLVVRAWNAGVWIFADAAVWLAALIAAAYWLGDARRALVPTLMIAVALEGVVLVTAPTSEGRYGLFILVCSQIAVLMLAIEVLQKRCADA